MTLATIAHDTGHMARAVEETLRGRTLVIVSNREPYVHRRGVRGVEVERPEGGLVAALDPVLQATGGVWVAWGSGDADFEVADDRGCVPVPPGAPRYTLRRVRLIRPEVDRYYLGFANQSIWPLFHMAMDKARFTRRYWTAYQAVNRRFADAVMETVGADAVVWIHDYHLGLCPRYLRQRRPDLFLTHFWHIPWPARDVYRICPQRAELLEGMLANDLIGFHVPSYVQNFLDCAEQELGAAVDRAAGVVEYEGHRTRVAAFPISIDVGAWEEAAACRACERWMAHLIRRFRLRDRLIGVGVDRIDYTKGIPERLRALELLFQRYPRFRERFVFIQKAAPSRTRIQAYRQLQETVEEEIARINAQYGTDTWQPIIYIPRPLPPEAMAALYRMADVCLVTPLQDGMNLVAKEFVASQVDGRGVLVLSEMAGAIEEAAWAVPVNPFDPEGVADALAGALEMPPADRQCRMRQMRAHLRRHDIYHWMAQHFQAAGHLLAARAHTGPALHALDTLRRDLSARGRLAVLLDFDGTLAPIADRPEDAQIPPATRATLARLARHPRCTVAVISGRTLEDVQRRVNLDGVVYAGNHGLECTWDGGLMVVEGALRLRDDLAECSRSLLERLRNVEGVIVEDKGLSLSVHYRLARPSDVDQVEHAVLETLNQIPAGRLKTVKGHKVLEIRPDLDRGKGSAALWLLAQVAGPRWRQERAVLYAGDDTTDEDAFAALAGSGVTVRVGPAPQQTAAGYSLQGPEELARLLAIIAGWLESDALVTAGHDRGVALPTGSP
ncbi:MAG: bifunctional alpha,alpha-trehalose-phosphate synthase (UDP-forming)/trehalose-phosphatase [Armatimonadetes bacterium]|nr:bifunctional alpha,alpha-trehalose-phosphate synthase (UDP-forming)/trehalose-phosphatase [Armatimonadota bacterium]